MVPRARQLCAAGLLRGTERRVVLLLVAGAAEAPLGVRVGEAGHTVGADALRELPGLLHKGRIPEVFVLAAWGQTAARLLRGTERRVVLLLVADAAEPPAGIRVGEAGHTVRPHAPRELDRLLLACGRPRMLARQRAAGCHQDEGAEYEQNNQISGRKCQHGASEHLRV